MDQFKTDHIILNFLKVVSHNFHLVHSWMLYLQVSLKSTTNSFGIYPKHLQCLQKNPEDVSSFKVIVVSVEMFVLGLQRC